MVSVYGRIGFWLCIFAVFWTLGETCIPGSTSPDPDQCDHYYLCIKSGASTLNILRKCPDGQNYDPNRGYCNVNFKNCLVCD